MATCEDYSQKNTQERCHHCRYKVNCSPCRHQSGADTGQITAYKGGQGYQYHQNSPANTRGRGNRGLTKGLLRFHVI